MYNDAASNLSPRTSHSRDGLESQYLSKASKIDEETGDDLIDFTAPSAGKGRDLYSPDIDYMNSYLKSLPDYSASYYTSPKSTPGLTHKPIAPPSYGRYQNEAPPRRPSYHSPLLPRKQLVPLSKSNSIHTFSKRNIGTIHSEKESFTEALKHKISRSTSSSTIPQAVIGKPSPETYVAPKKSSNPLMNMLKNLSSQKSTPSNSQDQLNETRPPSLAKRSIGDFWRNNLSTKEQLPPKFGWNYNKIISHAPNIVKPIPQHPQVPSSQKLAQQSMRPVAPPRIQSPQNLSQSSQTVPPPIVVRKLDPIMPSKVEIVERKAIPQLPQLSNNSHIPKDDEPPELKPKPQFKLRKNYSHSQIDKKLKDEQQNAIQANPMRSTSSSYIYTSHDDPNYFKNLHQITENLDNATTNMIKKPLYKSISNSCVPNYLAHQQHPGPYQFYNNMNMISHYPQYHPVAFKPHQDPAHASKSNIPVLFKYPSNPLHKSISNTSVASSQLGSTATGYYSVPDSMIGLPNIYWPAHVNKSSSGSCIFAKTLSQPAHLSKNNDIFARYKPILSDDDDNSTDDEILEVPKKHLPLMRSSKPINIQPCSSNSNVSSFKPTSPSSGSVGSIGLYNYPPFTKSTIQVPQINGQLPPAFKKMADISNNIDKPSDPSSTITIVNERKNSSAGIKLESPGAKEWRTDIQDNIEQTIADIYNIGNNFRGNKNSAPVRVPAKPAASKHVTQRIPPQPLLTNNVFYGFGASSYQGQSTPNLNQPEVQYTPYSQILSDRKYFDMNFSSANNVSVEQPKRPAVSGSLIPTFKDKVKTVNNIGSQRAEPEKQSLMSSTLCFNNGNNSNSGDNENSVNNDDLEPITHSIQVIAPPNTINNYKEYEAEILSTFDPYYNIPTTVYSDVNNNSTNESSTNKLHQLLTTVKEQWNTADFGPSDSPDFGTDFASSNIEVHFWLSKLLIAPHKLWRVAVVAAQPPTLLGLNSNS